MRKRTAKIVKTVSFILYTVIIFCIALNIGLTSNQETEYIQEAIRNGMTCFSGCAEIDCDTLKVISYDNCPSPEEYEASLNQTNDTLDTSDTMEYYINMSDNQTLCHPEGDYQTGWGVDC